MILREMTYLDIGDVRRPPIGRAIKLTVVVGIAFSLATFLGKEVRALYSASPWADDPYDAFVSFAIFFAPMLTGLLLVRLPLCRKHEPLPAARASGMLRASRVLLLTAGVTVAAEWVGLALDWGSFGWSTASALLVVTLGALTAITLGAAWLVVRAPAIGAGVASGDGPDWLADAVATGRLLAAHAGPISGVTRSLVDGADRWIVGPVRARPVSAAALVSLLFGIGLAAAASLEEGLGPVLLLVVFVGACAMFVFLTAGGWYLNVVRPTKPLRGAPARTLDALVAAAAAVPLTLAFRNVLWPGLDISAAEAGPAHLAWLVLGAGLFVFAVVFALETALRTRTD